MTGYRGFPKKCSTKSVSLFVIVPSLIAVLLFCGSGVSVSSAQDLLTLYRSAQENDPQIRGAGFRHKASRETKAQAFAGYLPVFTAQGEYMDTSQDIVSSDNTVFAVGDTDFKTKTYGLTLTQPVFNWASYVRIGQAYKELDRADMEFEVAKQDLMLRITDLYLQALATQDNVTLTRAEETAVEAHYELAKARHSMGLTPITDLHDAKARRSEVKARRIESENALDDALQALREVCGEESLEKLSKLREDVPLLTPVPADIPNWMNAAGEQNLRVQTQKYAVEVAKEEVSRQSAGHWPTVDLIGRYYDRDTDGSLFGGGSEVKTTDLVVQLNWTLFQGGYVWSRTKEARELMKAAQEQLEREVRAARRQARFGYLGVEGALSRAEALEEAVVSQGLALEAKQLGFKSGLYTSLVVLDAERDLYYAKRELAKARYDYILNSVRLKQAAGSLSESDLAAINEWFQ